MRYFAFCLFALALSVSAVAAPKSATNNEYAPASGSLTAMGVADTSNISTGQSLSAMFSFNRNWLQTYMTIDRTQGTFVFGLGGIYKFTVAGDARMGFHVGPGFSVGTVPVSGKSKFAFSLFGMAGGHFTLFDRLILSVDGGPMVNVVDGDANFSMKPMGETLGLGIHYFF
jgi:hypothetical protein